MSSPDRNDPRNWEHEKSMRQEASDIMYDFLAMAPKVGSSAEYVMRYARYAASMIYKEQAFLGQLAAEVPQSHKTYLERGADALKALRVVFASAREGLIEVASAAGTCEGIRNWCANRQ